MGTTMSRSTPSPSSSNGASTVAQLSLEPGPARVRASISKAAKQQADKSRIRHSARILEGELRFNMVNNVCLGIIHKVPAPGGMSAVGGTGSVYEFYDNATLTDQKMTKFDYKAFVYKEPDAAGNR